MLKPSLILAVTFALAGCLVEATDPPGTTPGQGNGSADAAPTGTPAADAGPGVGGDAAPIGPDATPTPAQLLAAFGNCMRQADWDAAGLGQVALVQTIADGNCAACHSAGLAGAYLNVDSLLTLTNSKTFPYVQRYAKLDVNNNFVVSDDLVIKGLDPNHPAYTLPAALVQGITDFFGATNAHYVAGACPDPALGL